MPLGFLFFFIVADVWDVLALTGSKSGVTRRRHLEAMPTSSLRQAPQSDDGGVAAFLVPAVQMKDPHFWDPDAKS
jgi:hypothetical protein